MPQRPPASIDMLQSVSRPSIDSAAHRAAGEFDRVALRAVGADAGDDRRAPYPWPPRRCRAALDLDPHSLRFLLPQRLRHQHMGDFGRADPEGIGAEGAVGGGVAVAADDQQAGQGHALFGPDHMDNALPGVALAEQVMPCLRRVRIELRTMRRPRAAVPAERVGT